MAKVEDSNLIFPDGVATIIAHGCHVVIGDQSQLIVKKDSSPPPEARDSVARHARHLPIQQTSLAEDFSALNLVEVVPLKPEEALQKGLERLVGDFHHDFCDQLAGKLNGTYSPTIANWERVAHVLNVDSDACCKINRKNLAHRILFERIRNEKPWTTLEDIRKILEEKLSWRRVDIFHDYTRKEDLPELKRRLADLNKGELELVLENVADRLTTQKGLRGNWKHLGGLLGYSNHQLDEIEQAGEQGGGKSPARHFIDFLSSLGVGVQSLFDAIKQVKRNDVKNFMKECLKADNCWARPCAHLDYQARNRVDKKTI